ncbi:hypothetical protein NQZ79_g4853 [Umbelopsis isabellina]|nr:hypothetical protein NQZ79_g4853 [Umbelopsis isabellina]
MGKKSKIDSGDYQEIESVDPPPPYIPPEEPSGSNTYENPYPQVPEELVEPSAPPVPETVESTESPAKQHGNSTVIRIQDNDYQVYPNGYYTEGTPLLNNDHAVRYRYRGFPAGAIIFLLGWGFPPLWLVGACCCMSSRNPFNVWWARASLIMFLFTMVSALLAGVIVITVGPESWRIHFAIWIEKAKFL